jgi:5'-nucleotidase
MVNTNKIRVLLTNDDGFYAEGLQTLYTHIKELAEVVIVAPDQERSAVGHGITMHHPLRAKVVDENENTNTSQWMVDGTPADCVKLALEHLIKNNPPDLIISGINRGPNLGSDVLYSGTVSAAIEGSFYKIPSLATSLAGFSKMDFNPAADFVAKNLLSLRELASDSTLNLNFPLSNNSDTSTGYRGARFTRMGIRTYRNVIEERKDPRGQIYFWMAGEPISCNQEPDTDIQAVDEGYISITPLHSDFTDLKFLEKYSNISSKLSII